MLNVSNSELEKIVSQLLLIKVFTFTLMRIVLKIGFTKI